MIILKSLRVSIVLSTLLASNLWSNANLEQKLTQIKKVFATQQLQSSQLQHPEAFSPQRFFSKLQENLTQVENKLSPEKWSVFQTHIRKIHRRVQFLALNNEEINQGELYSQIRRDVQRFVHEMNQEEEPALQASLVQKLVRDAKKAPSQAKEINEKMHVYGTQTWTNATGKTVTIGGVTRFYPGWNSCARVVTAIMKHTGYGNGIFNLVRKYERYLQRKGFKVVKYDDMEKGDVVIWKKGGLNHIGIYTGWGINMEGPGWTTVDNWSISGEPEHRPLNRSTLWGWEIRKILRPNR